MRVQKFNVKRVCLRLGLVALMVLSVSGCGVSDGHGHAAIHDGTAQQRTALESLQLDSALEDRILALSPENISEEAIREVLSRGPVPRIINLHGGLPLVHLAMKSFAEFLIAMGYPEAKIRDPSSGAYSYSPYRSSEEIAGFISWYYEKEGTRAILVGHSLGGIRLVQVLHQLNGDFHERIAVWDPVKEQREERTSIVDPLTGAEKPVVGLSVSYATAVAAGGLGRLLDWGTIGRLRTIPDTVEEFTGFFIGFDLLGGDFLGLWDSPNAYRPTGKAQVRNVRLPTASNHLTVTATKHLAQDQTVRDWINAYVPGKTPEFAADVDVTNILWAADVWRSIKRHWCLEAQRLVRSKRALGANSSAKMTRADKAFG